MNPEAGAWIIDKNGQYQPDLTDPAMAERYGAKKEKEVTSHVSHAKKQSPVAGEDRDNSRE